MQEKEMTPKERKCGNCAARISTHPKPECGDAYCRAPGRPETTICDEDSGCPDHRSAAEQAARWEARGLSDDAWLTSKADHEARESREQAAAAVLAEMAAKYKEALAGVADAERAAVVAGLRWLADVAFCQGFPTKKAGWPGAIAACAARIEAGEHRKGKP